MNLLCCTPLKSLNCKKCVANISAYTKNLNLWYKQYYMWHRRMCIVEALLAGVACPANALGDVPPVNSNGCSFDICLLCCMAITHCNVILRQAANLHRV